jgi:hypothetical protein
MLYDDVRMTSLLRNNDVIAFLMSQTIVPFLEGIVEIILTLAGL